MAEYISRKAALEYIRSEQCRKCSDIGLCGNCAVLVAARLLEKIPAADVVPVVRCKDCANFRQNVHGVCWCDEYGGAITPEDYCSRAVTDKPSRAKIPWEAD